MRVNIQAAGKFTAYHAARAAHRRQILNRLITGRRRRDEGGIPFSRRRHIAWPAYLFYALATAPVVANRAAASRIADNAFDRAAARRAEPVEVFHGFLAYSLCSMQAYRHLGARVLVDTGAAHIGYEYELLGEEFARFGETRRLMDTAWVYKQEREYHEADAIIVPSTFVRDTLTERGIPASKIEILRHGVDTQRFQCRPLPTMTGPLRVVSVGAISLEKGVPYLLDACKLLRGRVSLTLVGRVFPEMRRILGETEVEFQHIASVPNRRMADILAEHEVFVLASVQDGSAMAVTEAMSVGRPVVITDHNGARDFVVDGSGVVVPSRNPQALADAFEGLIARRQDLPSMGAAAHDAVKHQTWNTYGDALAAIYERQLA